MLNWWKLTPYRGSIQEAREASQELSRRMIDEVASGGAGDYACVVAARQRVSYPKMFLV